MIRPRNVLRKLVYYVRHDLREIVFPSSLPDPLHLKAKARRKLSFQEHLWVWKMAVKLYVESWRGGSLSYLDDDDGKDKATKEKEKEEDASKREPSVVEEVAIAARLGAENIKPALQRVYVTRAKAYRDALSSFVQGYQQGVAEVMAQNDAQSKDRSDSRSQSEDSSKSGCK